MADSELHLFVLADTAQAEESMGRLAAVTDATGNKIGASGALAGEKFASGIDSGTSKLGGIFTKLGNTANNFGLPFGNQLNKIGNDLNTAGSKAKGFGEAMSAVGGVAVLALAGVAAESVHLADKFDTAQASLQTAVKNSGGVWAEYSAKVKAAAGTTGALVSGNATDVDQALATLTTATQSTSKALGDLNLVENIAAMRHESLSDAAAQYARILGGNVRILATWGINLDIGSGKLHSVQSAMEAAQKAALNLQTVQAEIASGQKTGAEASGALATAELDVRNADLNLKQSHNAIAEITAVLNERTKNAAKIYGQTLAGQIHIAGHELENLGIDFGQILIPKIQDAEKVLVDIVGWFERNKVAAEILGGVIVTVLGAAITLFTYNMAVKFVSGIENMISGLGKLAATVLTKMGVINTATEEQAAVQLSADGQLVASLQTQANAWNEFASQVQLESARVLASTGQIDAGLVTMAADAQAQAALFTTAISQLGVSTEDAATAVKLSLAQVDTSLVGMADTASVEAATAANAMTGLAATVETDSTAMRLSVNSIFIGLAAGLVAYEGAMKLLHVLHPTVSATGSLGTVGTAVLDFEKMRGIAPVTATGAGQSSGHYSLDPIHHPGVGPSEKDAGAISGSTLAYLEKKYPKQWAEAQAEAGVLPTISSTSTGAGAPKLPKLPGETIPKLAATPGVSGAGGTASTAVTPSELALENIALQLNAALGVAGKGATSLSGQKATVANLTAALTTTHKAELDKLVSELNATHNATLTRLAGTLQSTWAADTAKLTTILDADTKAGQSMISTYVNATTSDSLVTLREDVNSIHKKEMDQLVNELRATHNTALAHLSDQIVGAYKAAQSQLIAQLLVQQKIADADTLQLRATQLQGMTTLATDAANKEVTAVQDAANIISTAMSNAATAITDATQAMNDAAQSQVTAIGAQAQTQADILGERGLYGLNLEAQQAKVALDQMTSGYDTTIGGLQQAVDAVKTSGDQSIGTAQALIAQAASAQNSVVSAAQQNLDAITAQQNNLVQQAQARVDLAAQGSQLQQQQAAAALKQAQATAAETEAQASSQLAAATAQQNLVNAQAQAALSGAQGNASVILAQAQQALAVVQNQANVAEANQQAIIQILQAEAQTQYAGSGVSIYITGIPANDAAAISAATSYALRYQVS